MDRIWVQRYMTEAMRHPVLKKRFKPNVQHAIRDAWKDMHRQHSDVEMEDAVNNRGAGYLSFTAIDYDDAVAAARAMRDQLKGLFHTSQHFDRDEGEGIGVGSNREVRTSIISFDLKGIDSGPNNYWGEG